MAGDWVAACKNLPKKPEVIRLADVTGQARANIVYFLVWEFWAWADDETEDGTIAGCTVNNLIDVCGQTEAFWLTMVEVGWLAVTPNGICIPNFRRWMGKSAKQRLNKSARQARWRAPGAPSDNKNVDASASTKAPTTEQNRTYGECIPHTPSCSEPEIPASEPSAATIAPDPLDRVVLAFPVVGKGATEWTLREAKLREYADCFAGLDVLGECRKALQWVRDNPSRRKTPRGMSRFLYSWLERRQNSWQGGTRGTARSGQSMGPDHRLRTDPAKVAAVAARTTVCGVEAEPETQPAATNGTHRTEPGAH